MLFWDRWIDPLLSDARHARFGPLAPMSLERAAGLSPAWGRLEVRGCKAKGRDDAR